MSRDSSCSRCLVRYVGIINRSQKDINEGKTISAHLESEKKYMDDHPAYSTMQNLGTPVLARNLNKELVKHIARWHDIGLPAVHLHDMTIAIK